MKILSDACWICQHINKSHSKKVDGPICSLYYFEEELSTQGVCPDFKDEFEFDESENEL